MFYGGTTRTFLNGANFKGSSAHYEPQVSSYVCDAPLDEAGNAPAKFRAGRSWAWPLAGSTPVRRISLGKTFDCSGKRGASFRKLSAPARVFFCCAKQLQFLPQPHASARRPSPRFYVAY